MLIVLPNDMSCCWQERAEGKEGMEETEVQNQPKIPVLSRVESILVCRHKNCNLFYYIFWEQSIRAVCWATNPHRFISPLDSISELIILVLCFSARQGAVTVRQEMV